MGLICKSLAVSFKEKSIFRFDYLVGTVFAFFYTVLKVYLWKGLYGAEVKEIPVVSASGRPVWFFPEGLKALSVFLPFRYIVFEPTAILVSAKSCEETVTVLAMQLVWIAVLYGAAAFVWSRGRRRLMIQGG